jgi:hypothetical protein
VVKENRNDLLANARVPSDGVDVRNPSTADWSVSDLYLTSSSGREPLRIGLLLDTTTQARYLHHVIEDIQKSNFASLQVVVVRQDVLSAAPQPRASLPVRAWRTLLNSQRRRQLLYRWYSTLDSRWNPLESDPLEPVDCSDLLEGVARLPVTPITKGFTHRFPPNVVARIRAYNLDVVLRFGFSILRGDILQSARYGTWSLHHGDNDYYRGGPAYFWELVEESPLSGVTLQVLTEELDAGHVLYKVLFSSVPSLSRQRNRWGPYWGSRHMLICKLHELHLHGWDRVLERSAPSGPYLGRRKIYRAPTNAEMVRWLMPRLMAKAVARPFRRPLVNRWRIGVRANGPALHAAAREGREQGDLTGFRWIDCPRGHSWADPFLFERDGVTWLFFEDFRHQDNRGVISVAPLHDDCTPGEAHVCLDLAYHLSYPNVFRHDGEVFMIPETRGNGTVELHRATRFPYEWKLEKVLFRGNVVDTSPWFDGERWWFFAGISEPAGHVALSMLFSADSLTGAWTAHPANPISSDVRTARNGGAIFSSGGKLFRPSQDCSGGYGRSVSFHEITNLRPEEYAERAVLKIVAPPSWGVDGLHTYNVGGRFEVIDAVKSEPRAASL